MNWTKEIWTYIIVTLVTVLIWFWAAGETRETKTINYARVHFTVPEPANWTFAPGQLSAILVVEGSKVSIQKAESLLRKSINITIQPEPGRKVIDLAEQLRSHDQLAATGINVLTVDPPGAEVAIDRIERFTAPVKPALPGVTPEGEITFSSQEVTVAMPSAMRQRFPQGISVEAFIDRSELDRLEQGVRHTRDVKLRLPEEIASAGEVTISPPRVNMSFTIRSRSREIKLDGIRVQVSSPPEEGEQYAVDIDPKQLRGITIVADADLVRRIQDGEVPVVAVLHLSAREKEARIESKRISYFMAQVPEPASSAAGAAGSNGAAPATTPPPGGVVTGARYVPVSFKGTPAELPVINLKITPHGS